VLPKGDGPDEYVLGVNAAPICGRREREAYLLAALILRGSAISRANGRGNRPCSAVCGSRWMKGRCFMATDKAPDTTSADVESPPDAAPTQPMPQLYKVMVDDNFHYMNKNELGAFATADETITACKRIVDEDLVAAEQGGEHPQLALLLD
jgi:hypothetical protein